MLQRVVGIDFGTSTSVIRTKLYNDDAPVGQRLDKMAVVFDNGASMVPTLVRRVSNDYTYGFDAKIPRQQSELFSSFKVDLQNEDQEKANNAKFLTEKFFEYLFSIYRHQLVTGCFGDPNIDDLTFVSFPVKWTEETRQFMLEAARKAGFSNVVGKDEAEAAITAVSVQCQNILENVTGGELSNVMLIDMGAGTTDIVISRCAVGADRTLNNEVLTVWPKGGDAFFGGHEMDAVLKDFIISKFPENCRERVGKILTVENIKAWKENTVSPTLKNNGKITECGDAENIAFIMGVDIDDFSIGRAELEEMFKDYILQFVTLITDAIDDSGLTPEDIDLIVLTGGHSQWYFIESILSGSLDRFGDPGLLKIQENPERILTVALPQEMVAVGLVYGKLPINIIQDQYDPAHIGFKFWKTYEEGGSLHALEKAALLKYPDAVCELASLYSHGKLNYSLDVDKALELYTPLANEGNAKALYGVGYCNCIKKNFAEAFGYLTQAAEKNVPEAYALLGVCHEFGKGADADGEKALGMYKKAIDLGYSPANEKYVKLYEIVHGQKPATVAGADTDFLERANKAAAALPVLPALFVGDRISTPSASQRCKRFSSAFRNIDISSEQKLCFYDDTFFGNGKYGFLMTDKRFYLRNTFGPLLQYQLDEISDISPLSNCLSITLKSGRTERIKCMYLNHFDIIADFLNNMLAPTRNA